MREIPNTNEIRTYMHCGKCMGDKPENISPQDWARTQTGMTPMGIQVWCNRCDVNVMHMDFAGAKFHANCSRQMDAKEKRAAKKRH